MTRLQALSARAPASGLLASAILTVLDTNQSPHRRQVHGPGITAAPKTAVCVLVPPKAEIVDDAAFKILAGSTMNGRYIDEAAANKMLVDKKARKEGVAPNFTSGALACDTASKAPVQCYTKLGGNNRLHVGHHLEPRRVAGVPNIRGEHVAMH